MPITPISTDKAPAARGPYSQAVDTGHMVFVAGQLPIDPATGEMPGQIGEQTRQCLENVKSILAEAGLGMDKVVKCTIFLTDFDDFPGMNEVYATFFSGTYPARSTVGNTTLVKGARIEIEAIAVR